MGLGIMRESPLEVGKRRVRKGMTRKGARTMIAIETWTGIETEKMIMIGNIVAKIVTGIVVGNAMRGGIGEEIGMMMMIITAVETMTGNFSYNINHFNHCSFLLVANHYLLMSYIYSYVIYRRRDYDRDRDDRHSRHSRSHSRGRSEHRSKSRSRSHSHSKR